MEFNAARWEEDMREAIASRDAERLSELMTANDGNGIYSYDDSCREFGWVTRGEWCASLVSYAAAMIDRVE